MNDFLGMLNPVARWLHIIAGVMWIGLLYFFNFDCVLLQSVLCFSVSVFML